jgi:short-subunit dehydrogenase
MPSLYEGATIVVISSQYVETPKKNYAYYAAVKSAVEAFTRSISLERPEFRWIVIRLPSLLTDQNNPVVPDARIMRTQEATRKILAAIQDLPSKPGFHLLELKT